MTAVSFVTRFYGAARGGIGRYEESLYPHLQRAVGAQLRPIQPWHLPRLITCAGRALGLDLAAFARNNPCHLPDVGRRTLVHLSNQTLALTLLFRRFQRAVVTVHDIIPYVQTRSRALGPAPRIKAADWLAYRLSLRSLSRAHAIITDAEHTKRELVTYLSLDPDRIWPVPLGVDSCAFRPMQTTPVPYKRYGLSPNERYILYVGSQEPRKNLAILYRALPQVRATIPDAKLLVAGLPRSTAGEAHRAQVNSQPALAGAVRFLDYVPQQDLVALYSLAHVFAMPSLYEGFGLPALEAMACGAPVVASNATSLPEVAGEAALLVDPHDTDGWARALCTLLDDEQMRREMRQQGLERAHQFTWERTAQETVAVYESLS